MKNLTVLPSLFAALLCSCSHYYYVANVQNVPLFKEKNEFQLSGACGGGDESTCIEAQAAYSITSKIAVMANFMHASGGNITSSNYGKGNYFEGAVGYFKPVSKYGVFQIYGGLGGSSQHHEYMSGYPQEYEGSSDLSFIKYFVQPSFGMTFNALDFAMSARFCNVNYYIINNIALGNSDEYNKINSLANTNHFNVEPAITVRTGWKNIKMQFQAEYAGLINNGYQSYANNRSSSFGEDWHISIGLNIAFAKRFKQSAKEIKTDGRNLQK